MPSWVESGVVTVKDVIGLVADLRTLLGITGFFSWAFIQEELRGRPISEVGAGVFAASVKFALCFFLVTFLMLPMAAALHFLLVLSLSGHYGGDDGLWNPEKRLPYLIAYSVTALLSLPVAVLTISSLWTWSLGPFRRFWRAFTRSRST
jgi:hypothetical protein